MLGAPDPEGCWLSLCARAGRGRGEGGRYDDVT